MRKAHLAVAALTVLAVLAGCTDPAGSAATTPSPTLVPTPTAVATPTAVPTAMLPPLPPPVNVTLPAPTHIGHVWIIVLENEEYNTTFPANGTPPSPYLAQNLTAMGHFLRDYYGTGHASLDNYIAMVSGQAPNALTQADCAFYADFVGTPTGGSDGQATGQGCVYPKAVLNIGDQLDAKRVPWRMYAEDMANVAAPKTCRHQPLNSKDDWQGSTDPKDQYATRHVPFVYFHSLIDDQERCDDRVVDLSLLAADLADANRTRAFSFITPDVCSDGHDAKCANPGQKGGYDGIDGFLRTWIPRIMDSTAFQQDGLIVVTFDEADAGSPEACCGEPTGPNTLRPGISGPGGGRVGAILIGPCMAPGTVDDTPHNHYSFLRTMEDLWAVPHLGYAGLQGLKPFDLGACTPAPATA